MTSNTTLQIINFNFYGDEVIALKDNATSDFKTEYFIWWAGINFPGKILRNTEVYIEFT